MRLIILAIFAVMFLAVSPYGAFLRSTRGAFIRSPHGARDIAIPISPLEAGIYVVATVDGESSPVILGFNEGTLRVLGYWPIAAATGGLNLPFSLTATRAVWGGRLYTFTTDRFTLGGTLSFPFPISLAAQSSGLKLNVLRISTVAEYAGDVRWVLGTPPVEHITAIAWQHLIARITEVDISPAGVVTELGTSSVLNSSGLFPETPRRPIEMPATTSAQTYLAWESYIGSFPQANTLGTFVESLPNPEADLTWMWSPSLIGLDGWFVKNVDPIWYEINGGTKAQTARNAIVFGIANGYRWGDYEFGAPPVRQRRVWYGNFDNGINLPGDFLLDGGGSVRITNVFSQFARIA